MSQNILAIYTENSQKIELQQQFSAFGEALLHKILPLLDGSNTKVRNIRIRKSPKPYAYIVQHPCSDWVACALLVASCQQFNATSIMFTSLRQLLESTNTK
jgi:hypothetical protein